MKLQRSLGSFGLMFSAISGIMGSAWLFGPYYAAQMSGPASLIAWVVGGLAMIIIAMTLAELVCMFPLSGGNARFMHFSHGNLSGFVFSWLMWLGYAAVAPVETMGVLQYLSSVMPSLTMVKSGFVVLTDLGYFVAAVILLLMCVLNFISIKWVARYNSVIVWFKLIVPIVVAISLIVVLFQPHNFTAFGGFIPNGFSSIASTLALGGVIFAFAGYAPAIVLAGEAKNPQKTVPLVLIGALVICLIIYLILEVAFIGVLTPQSLSNGWHNLHFVKDASPFVGIGEQLGLSHLSVLIFITAILAPLGTAFIFITTSSRVAFAMSENGYFPKILTVLNAKGAPTVAVILNFIVGLLLFFPAPGWQGMVGFLVSAFVLCYAVGPISLLALRKTQASRKRPFKLPIAKAWAYFAFLFANLMVYWTGWNIFSKMMVALLIGIVVIIVVRCANRDKNKHSLDLGNAWWVFVYLAGMSLISYLGSYGGGLGIIHGIMGIVAMAIFSLIILWLSFISKLKAAQVEKHLASIKI